VSKHVCIHLYSPPQWYKKSLTICHAAIWLVPVRLGKAVVPQIEYTPRKNIK